MPRKANAATATSVIAAPTCWKCQKEQPAGIAHKPWSRSETSCGQRRETFAIPVCMVGMGEK